MGNKIIFLILLLAAPNLFAQALCSSLFEGTPSHKHTTENSSYELLRATSVISENYPIQIKAMNAAFSFNHTSVFISDRLPEFWNTGKTQIPIRPILATHAILEKVMLQFGLEQNLARQMGFQIQKSIIQAMGLSWTDYVTFMKPYFADHGINYGKTPISSQLMIDAMMQIAQKVEVDSSYEVVYLAGYSKHNSKKIYIDKLLPKIFYSNGKNIDPTYFLVIHEVVEKALIDELKLKSDAYLPTHQIAQRLEMAAVLAMNMSWNYYQHDFMAREIARCEDPNRIISRIAPDIDLTPYKDSKDYKLIKKMIAAMPKVTAEKNDLFTFREIQPGVFFLLFNDRIELAKTLMRFQEHFESPEFKDRIFTREEFETWYKKENDGVFDYYDYWGDGFNFPGTILNPFYLGKFKNLTKKEQLILEQFKNRRHTNFYVIATAKNSETKTFEHEIAHALYYLNPKYKAEIEEVLDSVDIQPVEKFLKEYYGDYHDSVLRDEAHAWLMHNSQDLKKDGFDADAYKETTLRLQAIYNKYTRAH